MIRRFLLAVLLFIPTTGWGSDFAFSQNIAVTPHPLATQRALEIYRHGGNAVDAAVAVAFTLGVVEPQNSGLGGGGFLLVYSAEDRKVYALDYRETAPRLAAAAAWPPGASLVGYRASGVPGFVKGLAEASRRFGKLPFADLLRPAIALAEEGFEVTPLLAEEFKDRRGCLGDFPASRRIFLPGGTVLRRGDRLIQGDLARTLRLLAERGPGVFYEGEIARKIAADSERNGGYLRLEDLRAYRPRWREPITFEYKRHHIASMPPPSSGGLLLKRMFQSLSDPSDPIALVSVMKEAFRDRVFLGDPDFSQTTHATFADRSGNVVTMTNSLNLAFGSCVTVPETGILLNDHMDDFTLGSEPNAFGLVQGEANRIEAGKRPLSSMSPTIVFKDGRPIYALGTPGGPTIITNVFQTLVNLIDRGMTLQEAIDSPKLHHQYVPDDIKIEKGYAKSSLRRLKESGFKLDIRPGWGNVQAVNLDWERRRLEGASDRRGEGRVGWEEER